MLSKLILFYAENKIDLSVNLYEASEKGMLDTVVYHLGEGASVDEKDSKGMFVKESIHLLFLEDFFAKISYDCQVY